MNDEKNKKKAEILISALKGKNQLKEISDMCDLICREDVKQDLNFARIAGTSVQKNAAIDYLMGVNEQLISVIRDFIDAYDYVIDTMSEISATALDNNTNDGGIKNEKD